MTQTATETKTFYSRSAGLTLHPNRGKQVLLEGGRTMRVDEKIVEFAQLGDYGRFETDDPEIIAYLEKRASTPGADVMSAEAYNNAIIPDAMKVDALRDTNEQQSRMIEEQNRIIAELQRGQKSVKPPVQQ